MHLLSWDGILYFLYLNETMNQPSSFCMVKGDCLVREVETAMTESKVKSVIAWVLQILLAIFYVLASSGKIISRPQVIEMFRGWGFPDRFYLVIGVLEFLGAIGLLIPRVAGYAASGLIVIMIGATLTHLVNGEGLQILRPLIFMLLLAAIVYLRRPFASKPRVEIPKSA